MQLVGRITLLFSALSLAGAAAAGQVPFGTQQVISTGALFATSVCAADLDGDGDLDVLSASENDDKIAWYENSPSTAAR